MAKIYLVDAPYLKGRSRMGESLDMDIVNPIIMECQQMYIQPLLGSTLYKEILAQIDADAVTDANRTLLNDYVRPALVKWVDYEAPMELTYKFTSSGLIKRTGDNQENVDSDEMGRLMDRLKNKAEWYSERVTKFLCENETDYPSYNDPGTGQDVINPNKSNYQTGWFLD